jgi:hypothetical protein
MISLSQQRRQPVWKLVVDYCVMQSEVRMHWAEWAFAFITNRKGSKRQ